MPDLTIQVQEIKGHSGVALVVLSGSIDAKTVITFQTHLNSVKERGIEKFIMDMENVKYVNSTGLGYLINLSDSVNSDRGSISLVKVQPKVKVVFDMLGLNAFFKIYPTREEALKHLTAEVAPAPSGDPTAMLRASSPTPAVLPRVSSSPGESTPKMPVPAVQPAPSASIAALHIECQVCRSLLVVKETGAYKCPRCLAVFNYAGGGKVSFLPRAKALPVQLSLNFSPECTEGLLEFVRRLAGRTGFSGQGISEMQSAVKHTVDMIHKHAYAGNENNVYHVLLVAQEAELELRFADYGSSMNADKGDLFGPVKSVVDRFELNAHPKGGNVVRVTKKAR